MRGKRSRKNAPLREFGLRKLIPNASARHHHDTVTDVNELGQLRRHENNGGALPGELMHQAIDFGLGANVDPARRLVEDEHLVRP